MSEGAVSSCLFCETKACEMARVEKWFELREGLVGLIRVFLRLVQASLLTVRFVWMFVCVVLQTTQNRKWPP